MVDDRLARDVTTGGITEIEELTDAIPVTVSVADQC
jgi:hypothetical protein